MQLEPDRRPKDEPRPPWSERVGQRIRDIRHARGLTLVQLAEASALSHPFLSQLERGLTQPSIASLERIARALGSSQLELFALTIDDGPVALPRSDVCLVRSDDGPTGPFAEGSARLMIRGPRHFKPLEFTGDNCRPGDYFVHDEDEFVTVLDGAVVVDLAGDGEWQLAIGDSMYYPGGVSHRWWSPMAARYRLLVVKQSLVATADPEPGGNG